MGLKLFSSDSVVTPSCDTTPNPNPYRFNIIKTYIGKHYILIEVKYDHCTTYDGQKILIYKKKDSVALKEAIATKKLDPHFLDGEVSPIARFPYTKEGLCIAYDFVDKP